MRRHLTYANVMATLGVFIALGGTALASVIITKNSQVGRGTIAGHHPSSGDHPNIIGGSVNGADLSGGLKSSLKTHCPTGYTLAAHSNLCFEFDRRSPATFTDALKTCAGNGGHLPSPGELAVAYDNLSPFQVGQWTTSMWFPTTNAAAMTMSQGSTRQITFGADNTTSMDNYRCVTSPSN